MFLDTRCRENLKSHKDDDDDDDVKREKKFSVSCQRELGLLDFRGLWT
jgi:hypothetical protein